MEDLGIINCFWTAINSLKLGFYAFRIYINFLDVSSDIKNEIIQFFKGYKNVWTLQSANGPIDLGVVVWADDIYNFNLFWNKTLDKYGNYFEKYVVSILTQLTCMKKSYLLKDQKKNNREFYLINCIGKPETIDKIDFLLLNEIAINARTPLIKLAEKLETTSQTINYRIKNLINKEIIKAFRVNIDISKLGLQNCMIDIYLKDHTKWKRIEEYIKKNPNVDYIMDMSIGWCDLNFQLVVKNIDVLSQLVEDIEDKYPGAVRKTNFWMSRKIHKERWLPELYQL
jgi:DNA-binding Lrp family transcriptional regulator